jgi:L-threonylcarbamoyladenylate synthase
LIEPTKLESWRLRQVAMGLLDGKVIAYPTEAVWGLGCDPDNEAACLRLLQIKQRPVSKGLILIAANMEQLGPLLTELSSDQRQQLKSTWPGPVTWLIPDYGDQIPPWIKGDHSSVAVRVTAHPLAAALCLACGGPLVSSSANKAGKPPARSSLQVIKHLGSEIDGLVHGPLGSQNKPSRIVDLLTGKILR